VILVGLSAFAALLIILVGGYLYIAMRLVDDHDAEV
jgi:hypothetical protein